MLIRMLLTLSLCVVTNALAEPSNPSDREISEHKPIEAYVYHCHDGDTCRIRVADSMWINVRLAGIDTPEVANRRMKSNQNLGIEARDYLNGLISGKIVYVKQLDLDNYNRPIVLISLSSDAKTLVNLNLVEKGFAEVYRGATKRLDQAPFLSAEQLARKERKGIWKDENRVSPSDFRKNQDLR